MMVASIVQVDMDPSFLGMCSFDCLEQGDQASCIDLGHFQYLCLARLQIDRAMNVERLATGCLFDRDRNTRRLVERLVFETRVSTGCDGVIGLLDRADMRPDDAI